MPSEWLLRFRALSSGSSFPQFSADSADSADSPTINSTEDEISRGSRPIGTIGTIGTQHSEGPLRYRESNAEIEPDWRDLLHKYDGGYTRAQAERLAWGALQNRWHMEHGNRVPRDLCAGCRQPLGSADALSLIDGCRVHLKDNHDCLIRYGERWRTVATRALLALGVRPPQAR